MLTATSPRSNYRGTATATTTSMMPNYNEGKMTRTGDNEDMNDNRRGGLMMGTPAPITTTVSDCLQGGLGVLMADRD